MLTNTAGSIPLDMDKVKELFSLYDNQHKVLVEIYKAVFPDWDDIKSIKGSPSVSSSTWREICALFIDFDRKHHPKVLAGGIWVNRGFNSDCNLEDGVVGYAKLSIQYKEGVLLCKT